MRELKDILGDGFTELVDTFLADAEKHVGYLEEFVCAGDLTALERPAHALKGSSANVGAMELMAAAAAIVTQCRSGQLVDPAGSVARVRACFEQVAPLLVKLR